MRRLLIVAAGPFAREVLSWALDVPASERDWEVAGFLDARSDMPASYRLPYPVLGDPATFDFRADDLAVCAIGDPRDKLKMCRQLEGRGTRFATLIHPSAVIGEETTIGAGSILCPGAVITCNVKIGRHCTINVHSSIGHDAILGEGCTLSGHCDITGHVQLGEGVFLGTHAAVTPKVKVGAYAVIGAGSVAMRDVPAGATVLGIPARTIFQQRTTEQ